jgi:hypothetical protein
MHLRTKLIIFNVIVCMYYEASSQNIDSLPALIGPEPKFTYEDCGCAYKMELQIYNGLYPPYGGQLVEDKLNIGAITVTNINDTDGDDPNNSNFSMDKYKITLNNNLLNLVFILFNHITTLDILNQKKSILW